MSLDEHDRRLHGHVRPADWVNPEPKTRYHLVVIGAGTAGLVSAAGAAGLGASVALIERQFMGGDCLNFGCVPSKALLRAARAVADVRAAREFGVEINGDVHANFAAIMDRMRRLRADISPNDSVQRFRDLGVDVFLGDARFAAPDCISVGASSPLAPCGRGAGGEGYKSLRFRRAIIATGTSPAVPAIPGLADASYLTNETIFGLTELPARLAIIGAGAIGCELAQAFARFGSRVTLFCKDDRILRREDPNAAALITSALQRDGVQIEFRAHVSRVEAGRRVVLDARTLEVDAVLVTTGRTPNVEGMGLEQANVQADARAGILVNDRLQTTNGTIFAAGDVCSQFKYTHAADAYARIAIQNALFYGRAKASALVIPRCLYTDPELAHVGWNEIDAQEAGIPIDTFLQEFAHVDRAILDGESAGFAKIHIRKGTDKIVGGTIVARHAGDMIGELSLAMTAGIGLATFAKTIHPYPTQAEALKKVGDAYNKTRLTPTVRWLFGKWFQWT